jgi:hypothetical protein
VDSPQDRGLLVNARLDIVVKVGRGHGYRQVKRGPYGNRPLFTKMFWQSVTSRPGIADANRRPNIQGPIIGIGECHAPGWPLVARVLDQDLTFLSHCQWVLVWES